MTQLLCGRVQNSKQNNVTKTDANTFLLPLKQSKIYKLDIEKAIKKYKTNVNEDMW